MYDELSQLKVGGSKIQKNLESFAVEASCRKVRFHTKELTTKCPVTNQPDFYDLDVELDVDGRSIETKSLKTYLMATTGESIFCENLAHVIAQDIFEATMPKRVVVTLRQQVRGGITLTAIATLEG